VKQAGPGLTLSLYLIHGPFFKVKFTQMLFNIEKSMLEMFDYKTLTNNFVVDKKEK